MLKAKSNQPYWWAVVVLLALLKFGYDANERDFQHLKDVSACTDARIRAGVSVPCH